MIEMMMLGLVAYRDHGDAYVTKVVDLSADLDSVYATLMDFQAHGGGDGPESVNKALYDAVHSMSWSEQDQAYQVIFLVGDAPPHMDYNEVRYPEIVATALDKGIVVNTIQCGDMPTTVEPWAQIASLSHNPRSRRLGGMARPSSIPSITPGGMSNAKRNSPPFSPTCSVAKALSCR